jgi:hypothetical protein
LTYDDYQTILTVRENLCAAIYSTLSLQDVSEDVVTARAVAIASILMDISQITESALRNCSAALTATVNDHPELAGQSDIASPVARALSNVLEKARQ